MSSFAVAAHLSSCCTKREYAAVCFIPAKLREHRLHTSPELARVAVQLVKNAFIRPRCLFRRHKCANFRKFWHCESGARGGGRGRGMKNAISSAKFPNARTQSKESEEEKLHMKRSETFFLSVLVKNGFHDRAALILGLCANPFNSIFLLFFSLYPVEHRLLLSRAQKSISMPFILFFSILCPQPSNLCSPGFSQHNCVSPLNHLVPQ